MTHNKNRWILTVIDYATRWVEAIPLKNIDTVTVSEALCSIFARFGFPSEVLSDGGTQFTSNIMQQVMKTVGITHKVSTPYHPQTNGLCERANATIKDTLRKSAYNNIGEWDRQLPFNLFALRATPQETTKYTPFELVYGFIPRTPLSIVKNNWLNENDDLNKPLEQYIIDLRSRILKSCDIAAQHTLEQQVKSKKRYDKTSKARKLVKGDRVLLLLSKNCSKLERKWEGPYEITDVISPVNYKININGKEKLYHVNMLQKYHNRPKNLVVNNHANFTIIDDYTYDCEPFTNIELPQMECTENYSNVIINKDLNEMYINDVQNVLKCYNDIFSDLPGTTDCVQHVIELTDHKPVKLKPYPLPFTSQNIVENEIDYMLREKIIKESTSPYAAPIVLVKKKMERPDFV